MSRMAENYIIFKIVKSHTISDTGTVKVKVHDFERFTLKLHVTFDLLILKIMFLFFKNTVKILKFR